MANYKRKHFKSSTMQKCTICGSQRRGTKPYGKAPLLAKIAKKEIQGIV